MDFSSLNPVTANALSFAARNNDIPTVKRLLKKINPNCIDNRGWTCLHEAASAGSYESLLLILQHPDIRPLAEDHEGCTALQVACVYCASFKTIKALLEHVPDIANYGNTENFTPLHIVSTHGRTDVMQLLLEHNAMIDVQDFDGHTALHDAALGMQTEAVNILLAAGADAEIMDDSQYTAFHFACYKGSLETVKALYPYVNNINQVTISGDSALMLATMGSCEHVVSFLLEMGADPHIRDVEDDLAINIALKNGHSGIFKKLLHATSTEKLNHDIILHASKPHYMKMEILESLLLHDLGPEFFYLVEPFHVTLEKIGDIRPTYLTSAPLNSFLNVCEYVFHTSDKFKAFLNLFLLRGVPVNALNINECPPLVYIHYSTHASCFTQVFQILCQHGCNVDYCTTALPSSGAFCIPDAFVASITSSPCTMSLMMPYSLMCEPEGLLNFANQHSLLPRIPIQVQMFFLFIIGLDYKTVTVEKLPYTVMPLNHLCRMKVRACLRKRLGDNMSTKNFLKILDELNIPQVLKDFLRYK